MRVQYDKLLGTIREAEAEGYDDMLGEVRSSLTGATAWNVAAIGDTGFILRWLRNNSSDFFQLKIQCPHRRKRESIIADIHIHYCLGIASNAGETVKFDVYYTWLAPRSAVPAIASWVHSNTITQTLGDYAANYYSLFDLFTNIAAPSGETYGSMLLVKVIRGNGTYTGEYGILDADAHSIMEKFGSKYAVLD